MTLDFSKLVSREYRAAGVAQLKPNEKYKYKKTKVSFTLDDDDDEGHAEADRPENLFLTTPCLLASILRA